MFNNFVHIKTPKEFFIKSWNIPEDSRDNEIISQPPCNFFLPLHKKEISVECPKR